MRFKDALELVPSNRVEVKLNLILIALTDENVSDQHSDKS